MTVCDQSLELAPLVLTNLITFFAMGGNYLKSYQVEMLLRMIPAGIPHFRVDVFVAIFAHIVRTPCRLPWCNSRPHPLMCAHEWHLCGSPDRLATHRAGPVGPVLS